MSPPCGICGTLTGIHGFSFDARGKELEVDRLLQEASVDDFGTPIPAVMRAVINKFVSECPGFRPLSDEYMPIGQLYRPIAKSTCINCGCRTEDHHD